MAPKNLSLALLNFTHPDTYTFQLLQNLLTANYRYVNHSYSALAQLLNLCQGCEELLQEENGTNLQGDCWQREIL